MPLATGSTAQLQFGATLNDVLAVFTGVTSNISGAFPQGINQTYQLGTGSASANQFQFGAATSLSVTAGSPVDIDLTTTLKSPAGVTFNTTGLIALAVANTALTGNLVMGNAAATAFAALLGATGTATILPGFTLVLFGSNINGAAAGYTVSGSLKNLRFTASAGTITYNLFALGF